MCKTLDTFCVSVALPLANSSLPTRPRVKGIHTICFQIRTYGGEFTVTSRKGVSMCQPQNAGTNPFHLISVMNIRTSWFTRGLGLGSEAVALSTFGSMKKLRMVLGHENICCPVLVPYQNTVRHSCSAVVTK